MRKDAFVRNLRADWAGKGCRLGAG
jgi:hypothetical protein